VNSKYRFVLVVVALVILGTAAVASGATGDPLILGAINEAGKGTSLSSGTELGEPTLIVTASGTQIPLAAVAGNETEFAAYVRGYEDGLKLDGAVETDRAGVVVIPRVRRASPSCHARVRNPTRRTPSKLTRSCSQRCRATWQPRSSTSRCTLTWTPRPFALPGQRMWACVLGGSPFGATPRRKRQTTRGSFAPAANQIHTPHYSVISLIACLASDGHPPPTSDPPPKPLRPLAPTSVRDPSGLRVPGIAQQERADRLAGVDTPRNSAMSVTFHNMTSSPRRSTSRTFESRYRCWTSPAAAAESLLRQ
jgi:hypothetical protein